MRLASYNIQSGGFAGYDYQLSAPKRLPQLQAAFTALDADVLCLVDTFRWDELYTAADLETLFGYPYSACINLNDDRLRKLGHNNGVAILSRRPLSNVTTHQLPGRDVLSAEVATDGGQRVRCVATYLDNKSEDRRLEQARTLIGQLSDERPVIVCGDLNTFSLTDDEHYKSSIQTFLERHPWLVKPVMPELSEMARGQVIPMFIQAGFKDIGSDGPTIPTPAFSPVALQPALRIDYCLCRGDIAVRQVHVPTGQPFDTASDHYPLSWQID